MGLFLMRPCLLLILILLNGATLPLTAQKLDLKVPDQAAEVPLLKAEPKVKTNEVLSKKIVNGRAEATRLRYEKRFDEAEKVLRGLCADIAQEIGTGCLEFIATKRQLCRMLIEWGKLKQAEPEIREALKACGGQIELEEEKWWLEALLVSNLIDQSKEDEAYVLALKVIKYAESIAKPDSQFLSYCYTCMGNACSAKGRYADAESFSRKAYELDERTLNPDHPDIAVSLHNLAIAIENIAGMNQDEKKHEEAEKMYFRSMALSKRVYGDKSRGLALTMSALAWCQYGQQKYVEAEKTIREAVEIAENSYSKNHPDLNKIKRGLAQMVRSGSRIKEAEKIMRDTLESDIKAWGEEHEEVASDMHSLGRIMLQLSNLPEAEKLFRQSLKIRTKVLGEDHADVAASLTNVALIEQSKKKYSEAEELFRRALAINQKVNAKYHFLIWTDMANLSDVLADQDKHDEAEGCIDRIITSAEEKFGKDSLYVSNWLRRLASMKIERKQYEQAEIKLRRAMEIVENSLGKEHEKTAGILHSMAVAKFYVDDYRAAEEFARRMVMIYVNYKKMNGIKHDHWNEAIDLYQHLLQCMGASFYEIDRRTNLLREGTDPGPAKIEERTVLKRI
jgi:tetratricopeptide (TPR) repeat protein